MWYFNVRALLRLSLLAATLIFIISSPAFAAEKLPPGFHRMPDGTIMANNPATAIAPPGYYLRSNGVLIKLDDDMNARPAQPNNATQNTLTDVPPGFHRMPDGRIMANNPGTAVAPPGYHLMPNGILMANQGGMTGSHMHHDGSYAQGMWMFEYRYTRMNMSDLLDTTKVITANDVVSNDYGYMASPSKMSMDMHMFMGMVGITPDITAMVMFHYMLNSMDMLARDGTRSTMNNSGFGDTLLSVFYSTPWRVVVGLGVGLPTGGIDAKGDMKMSATMNMQNVTLPYAMQTGTGSYAVSPSVEYSGRVGSFTMGTKFEYLYRVNDNDNGYRLGNRGELSGWGEWHAMKYFSVLAKAAFTDLEKIKGRNDKILAITNMGELTSPAADPTLYGGMKLNGTFGLKLNTANKMWGLRSELTLPLYQNLWGPQMKESWTMTLALEAMF